MSRFALKAALHRLGDGEPPSLSTEAAGAAAAGRSAAPVPRSGLSARPHESGFRSSPSALAWVGLVVLLIAAAVFLFYETRGTTFADDEWTWIFQRRGSGVHTFLDPHNDHLSLIPVSIYKLLFATAGLRTYTPYRVIVIGAHLCCVVLVFLYATRRVGPYFALLAAAVILFFGPGWQEFLWPFQVAWLIAIAAGIGALLMLDREDRVGNIGACVLLGVALASAGPGVAIAIGLVVEVLLRRRGRDLWIVAAPITVYALWWATYQQRVYSSPASLVPGFVFRAAAGALSSLAGLSGANALTNSGHFVGPGVPLLVIAVLLLAWRLHRVGYVPPRLLTLCVMALSFWITAGVGRASLKLGALILTATGDESRYLYISGILILLIGIEAARGVSASTWVRALAGVAVLAAVYSNLSSLRHGAQAQRAEGQLDKASLGTLEMTRSIVNPDFAPVGFVFGIVKAGEYLAAVRALGSPAASATQIAALPDSIRVAVDNQLIRIHQVSLKPVPAVTISPRTPPDVDSVAYGTITTPGACVRYRHVPSPSSPAGGLVLTLPVTGLLLTANGTSAGVAIRRFADQVQPIGTLADGVPAILRITPDFALRAWHIRIGTAGRVTACRLG